MDFNTASRQLKVNVTLRGSSPLAPYKSRSKHVPLSKALPGESSYCIQELDEGCPKQSAANHHQLIFHQNMLFGDQKQCFVGGGELGEVGVWGYQ